MGIKFVSNELTIEDIASITSVDFTSSEETIAEVLGLADSPRPRCISKAMILAAGITLLCNEVEANNFNISFSPSETSFSTPSGNSILDLNTESTFNLPIAYSEIVPVDIEKVDVITLATDIFSETKPLEGEDLLIMNEFTDKIIQQSGELKRR